MVGLRYRPLPDRVTPAKTTSEEPSPNDNSLAQSGLFEQDPCPHHGVALWVVGMADVLGLVAGAFLGLTAVYVGLIAFRSKTSLDRALEHPLRRRLFERVVARPGANLADLRSSVGGSRGSLRHHLDILERIGVVRACRTPRSSRFFPADIPVDQDQALALLRRGRVLEVALAIRANPTLAQHQITKGLSMSRDVFRAYANLMIANGLIEEIRDGRTLKYAPTRRLDDVIQMCNVPQAAGGDSNLEPGGTRLEIV